MTGTEPVRLQKAISAAGLMSRRAAEELIAAGKVTIDGRVAILGDRVDPAESVVAIKGRRIPIAPGLVTYLLYKPVGVVSTASDPQGRQTVVGLVPVEPRVWPVGRLDTDTEGLILVSNDGVLTNLVTHPRFGITKTYQALLAGSPGAHAIRRLVEGVDLDDGPARAISARILDRHGDLVLVEIVLGEGRNREIRRMADAVGHPVARLVRLAVGPVTDRRLRAGAWRLLGVEEVSAIYAAAGVAGEPAAERR